MFSALLIAGETHEARATGKELYDLALRSTRASFTWFSMRWRFSLARKALRCGGTDRRLRRFRP
jgi:hypothetical protein